LASHLLIVRFADIKLGVVEATRIADVTAWSSHDNTDKMDFGNNGV